jgi:hypothetical protein
MNPNTMNLINNIVLLIILLVLANYLSNGSIINVLLKYYEIMKNYIFGDYLEYFSNSLINRSMFNDNKTRNLISGIKEGDYTTPTVIHDSDFKYIYGSNQSMKTLEKEDDPIMKKLYYFLQGLVMIDNNFEDLNPPDDKENNLNQSETDLIRKFLNKCLNSNDFKFNNLQIIDNLTFYNNNGDKTIKPFQINSDVYLNHNEIGKLSLHIEMSIIYNNLFNGPIKNGIPRITRIKLTNRKEINQPLPVNDSEKNDSENSLLLNTITFTDINQERSVTFSEINQS